MPFKRATHINLSVFGCAAGAPWDWVVYTSHHTTPAPAAGNTLLARRHVKLMKPAHLVMYKITPPVFVMCSD